MFHLEFAWDAVVKYLWDAATTFLSDIVETYHWDVLVTFLRDVVGCLIWDVPATSLGRTERRHYDVVTTSSCQMGTCVLFTTSTYDLFFFSSWTYSSTFFFASYFFLKRWLSVTKLLISSLLAGIAHVFSFSLYLFIFTFIHNTKRFYLSHIYILLHK